MAKKRKRKNKNKKKKKEAKIKTKKVKAWIISILMFVLALVISLSFFEKAGIGGEFILTIFDFLVGKTISFIPFLLILAGILLLKPQKKRIFTPVFGGILLLLLAISGLFEVLNIGEKAGGILGYTLTWPFLTLFGFLVTVIVFSALILISILILWQLIPSEKKFKIFKEKAGLIKEKPEEEEKEDKKRLEIKSPQFEIKEIEALKERKETKPKIPQEAKIEKETFPSELKEEYKSPPIELLSLSNQRPSTGDIRYDSLIIKKTLANFGILVEMGEINIGPTVTQYTLKPAEGVKLSKITTLNNDLSLALASHPIRIEAPIPGRSLVGIEVPNRGRAEVKLRELISHLKFQEAFSFLTIPLGKDVAGTPVFTDLGRMPHLLVAGSTGTGKTVFLQNLILSLIYRNSPQILRFILIDPKRVEFSIYSPLPHLLTPVIYNAPKTVNVLNWLIGEMERRFEILSEIRTRNIRDFNKIVSKNSKLREEYGIMPYIILIIDELADLMAAKGREVEAGIVRLSQLARAVGIHLVVATQRPSVDVITGLIKANLTSRITFQVASQIDSRTVLDTAGAESLLGNGDMLFLSSESSKPRRIQGAYVSQKEVKKVINFIERENAPREKEEIEERLNEKIESLIDKIPGELDFEEPLYEEAKEVIIQYKKASASLLQRRLKIGYARAARILDMLEAKGIVGPADGAKPREVHIKESQNSNQDSEWEKI